MNSKPRLYNIELTNAARNDEKFTESITNIFHIKKEDIDKIVGDISNGKKTTVACVPLDIAKTMSEIFDDYCKKYRFSGIIHIRTSDKYDELV